MSSRRDLSLASALRARLSQRGARVVPYRHTDMHLLGRIDGGGRLEVGLRWPQGGFAPTELTVKAGGRLSVSGQFLVLTGSSVVVAAGAHLSLSNGYINRGTAIECWSAITIGEDAAIGPGVSIRDSDDHAISGSSGPMTQPITIGDHVWVGERAMILKGVTVGDGAVIAAGAVVTRDVEPGTLVAGVPARYVRHATWTHELS